MNGIPLVGWAVIQSLSSHEIDECFLSTDDDEIQSIAESYGATVIRRPDWPDANEVSAIRPMIHGIREIQRRHADFDTLVSILPTGPLNKPEDFDTAIRLRRQIHCDVVTPLMPLREVQIFHKISKNKARCAVFDKHYKYLGPSSGWCVTSPSWYLWAMADIESDLDRDLDKKAEAADEHSHVFADMYYVPMEPWQYADCDTLAEFEMGEILMERFILKGRGRAVYDEYAALKKTSAEQAAIRYAGNLNQQS
jgi:hypothetical protein